MATSTRNRAIELWGNRLPPGDPEQFAKVLFSFDNPPGTQAVSGSQDAIGIVFPGLARAHYTGSYWPDCIDHITDNATLPAIHRKCAVAHSPENVAEGYNRAAAFSG